jgi:hypothetical protein
MHSEDLLLAAVLEPLPDGEQIIDPNEEGLPAYERWNTHTYYTEFPDAVAWEMTRQRW